jgi:hypothetical protein
VLERVELYSSSTRYKFWVEGPTDVPAFAALLKKLPGGAKIRIQAFGGWQNILADDWSPRGYGDGCSLFSFVFDGDAAYDWSQPGRPIKPKVAAAIEKLRANHIEYHILDRYALENYFPRHAFEQVLGIDLSARFPLDETQGVVQQRIPGYSKALNAQIADATNLSDLAGTDLGEVLKEAADWVADE